MFEVRYDIAEVLRVLLTSCIRQDRADRARERGREACKGLRCRRTRNGKDTSGGYGAVWQTTERRGRYANLKLLLVKQKKIELKKWDCS